jgi:hypothetical protein
MRISAPTATRPNRRRRPVAVALALAATVAVGATAAVFALERSHGSAGSAPPRPTLRRAVRPVASSADPAQQARNLSAWLRANAG